MLATNKIANILGATMVADKKVSIFVPSKDDKGKPINGNPQEFAIAVGKLLAELAGGFSIQPVTGGYVTDDGNLIIEEPLMVFAFFTEDSLLKNLPAIQHIVASIGATTHQESMGVEIDGTFYLVTDYKQTTIAA